MKKEYEPKLKRLCVNFGLLLLISDLSGDVIDYVYSDEDEKLYEQCAEMREKRRKRELIGIAEWLQEMTTISEADAIRLVEQAVEDVPYTVTDVDSAFEYGDKLGNELITRMEN